MADPRADLDDDTAPESSLRRLTLRAVNSTIRLERDIGSIAAELSATREEVRDVKGEVRALRSAVDDLHSSDDGLRTRLDSVPELSDVESRVAALRAEFSAALQAKDVELARKERDAALQEIRRTEERSAERLRHMREMRALVVASIVGSFVTWAIGHFLH
jgi:chromosome segregation ATPase